MAPAPGRGYTWIMRTLLLSLLLLGAAALPAAAAVVKLKDGGSIEGGVVSATTKEVVIQTASGPRRIDAERVLSIEYEAGKPGMDRPSEASAGWAGIAAASRDDKNMFSIGFGLAAPLSDVDFRPIGGGSANNGDLGPVIGLRYLRASSRRLALGFDLDYLHRGGTDSPGLLPLADASVTGDNLLFMGVARWYVLERGPARPYVLAGLGVSRSWTRVDAAPIRGFAWTDTNTDEPRRLIDDGRWALAGTARAGADFDWDFAGPSVFGVEAGWTALQSRRCAATRAGSDLGLVSVSGPLHVFTLAARWGWRW